MTDFNPDTTVDGPDPEDARDGDGASDVEHEPAETGDVQPDADTPDGYDDDHEDDDAGPAEGEGA